jgi:hypothetical protein
LVAITVWLDGSALVGRGGLLSVIGYSGSWVLKGLVAFAALFVTFLVLLHKNTLRDLSSQLSSVRFVNPACFAGHLGSLAVFAVLAELLYGGSVAGMTANLVTILWLAAGVTAIFLAACAFIPFRSWRQMWSSAGSLSIYALMTSATACAIGAFARNLWGSAAEWTFVLVKGLLSVCLSNVFVEPSKMSIGTQSFHVEIAPQCSGLEGAALILGFCALWLWLLRREFRFPAGFPACPRECGGSVSPERRSNRSLDTDRQCRRHGHRVRWVPLPGRLDCIQRSGDRTHDGLATRPMDQRRTVFRRLVSRT